MEPLLPPVSVGSLQVWRGDTVLPTPSIHVQPVGPSAFDSKLTVRNVLPSYSNEPVPDA